MNSNLERRTTDALLGKDFRDSLKEAYSPAAMNRLSKRYIVLRCGDLATALSAFKATKSEVYTGIHSETDWVNIQTWYRGWHAVNTVGQYIVIQEKEIE